MCRAGSGASSRREARSRRRTCGWAAGDLTRIRAQVSLSALESLAVHLGGLREGRKSILYVSQGPPMLRGGARPDWRPPRRHCRGQSQQRHHSHAGPAPARRSTHRSATPTRRCRRDTGGRRIGLTNDFSRPLQGVMADASAYYLLGYESPATAADGKFRKINVDVRRGGVRVIARTGYWAPRPEDLRTAGRRLERADGPARGRRGARLAQGPVAADRRSPTGLASGRSTRDTARSRWSSRRWPHAPAPRVGAIELEVTGPDGVKSHPTPLEEPAGVWAVQFAAAPGRLRIRATVKNAAGEEIDSWSRDTIVPVATDGSVVGTPIVYRPPASFSTAH